jgi:hypothetical protein
MAKPDVKPKPKAKLSKKAQHDRFKEVAREHGADETGAEFERAFAKVVPPKRRVHAKT